MACGGSRVFFRLMRIGSNCRPPSIGELTVDWTTTLALVIAIVLVVYLAAALLVPEKFS